MANKILTRRDTAANWTAANPVLSEGEQGYETDTGKLKIGNGSSAWNSLSYFAGVSSPSGASVSVYATAAEIPASASNGDLALILETNSLFIWSSGWYNIALINQSPSLSGAETAYILSSDGTPTVVTLTGADPEGVPITYSYTTSGMGSIATVSQTDNVFTITPTTNEENGGSFSVTFTASDGVNSTSTISSFTLTFVSEFWYDVQFLLGTNGVNTQNNTFVERAINTPVTPAGTATQSNFNPFYENWSNYFASGTGLDIASFEGTGTNAWTLELFVNQTASTDATFKCVAGLSSYSTTQGWRLYSYGSEYRFYYTSIAYISVSGVTANKWQHLVVRKHNGTYTIFLDSVQGSSASDSTSVPTATLSIGKDASGVYPFAGYISNLRIVKDTDATNTVYTDSVSVPLSNLTATDNTILLTCQSNRFVDNSVNDYSMVPGGAAVDTHNPFGQTLEYDVAENKGSLLTDGNDYVAYTQSAIQTTDDFCFEFWFYAENTAIDNTRLFGAATNDPLLYFTSNGTNFTTILWYYANNNSTKLDIAYTFYPKTWYHIAVTRDLSVPNVTIYVNGKSIGTSPYTSYSIPSKTYWVGSHPTQNIGLVGYISDYKVTVGSKVYDGDFTPTGPAGATGASTYLPFDNAGIFDKSGSKKISVFGDTQTSNAEVKYSASSVYFDGTGDYIVPGDWKFGAEDFTIEGWFNFSAVNGALVSRFVDTSPPEKAWELIQVNGYLYFQTNTGTFNNGGTAWAPTLGQWYHIAAVRSGSNKYLFIDGVLQSGYPVNIGSGAIQGEDLLDIRIGMRPANGGTIPFNGYMEDVQVIKGQAKYTANFTPPTATLSRANQG